MFPVVPRKRERPQKSGSRSRRSARRRAAVIPGRDIRTPGFVQPVCGCQQYLRTVASQNGNAYAGFKLLPLRSLLSGNLQNRSCVRCSHPPAQPQAPPSCSQPDLPVLQKAAPATAPEPFWGRVCSRCCLACQNCHERILSQMRDQRNVVQRHLEVNRSVVAHRRQRVLSNICKSQKNAR